MCRNASTVTNKKQQDTEKKAEMDELRIVLLGKQGAGKSASGNTLLHKYSFHTAASSERVTKACSMGMSTVDKQTIKVTDTPGWSDSSDIKQEIKQSIDLSSPGPHAFLLVLPIGRFTNEEINTIMDILKMFRDEVNKYMIVLFTRRDDLEDRPIENYLKDVHSDLRKIIHLCGERYHFLNNRDKSDHHQVYSLLKIINMMVENNEEKYYTTALHQEVKNEEVKWLKERERQLKEINDLQSTMKDLQKFIEQADTKLPVQDDKKQTNNFHDILRRFIQDLKARFNSNN